MLHVYTGLFAREDSRSGLEPTCHMWWDRLGIIGKPANGDILAIVDAIYSVFEQVLLTSQDEAIQAATIHGIGHFAHPNRPALIDRFLDSGVPVSDELRRYAQAAREGQML